MSTPSTTASGRGNTHAQGRLGSSTVRARRLLQPLRAFGCGFALAAALAACGGGDVQPFDSGAALAGAAAARASWSVARSRAPLRNAATNLLSNPGFESGLTGWSDWGNLQVVDGAGADGASHALRVGTGAGGAGHGVGGVTAGAIYRVSAQARVSDPSEVVYIGLNMLDEAGSVLAQQMVQVSSTAWSLATVEAEAPANTVAAVPFVWKNAGSGHAFVDDWVLALADGATPPPPPPPPPPPGTNLLSNPDFETGMAPWTNWGNAQVIDGSGPSASRALRVGTGAGGAGLGAGGIAPGIAYRLTAQARVSATSGAGYVGLKILDDSGATLAEKVATVVATAYGLVTVDLAAPAVAARALAFVWKNEGSGYVFVDELVLAATDGATPPPAEEPPPPPPPEEPPPPPPPPPADGVNLVANGGFEDGLSGWSNWGNATASGAQPGAGTSSLQVGSAAGGLGQEVAGITAGQAYRVTGLVKVSAAADIAYLGLKFMDASGASLLEQNVAVSSTVYSTAQLDVLAPASVARALVYVWKNAGSGFAYVDEVAFAAVPAGDTGPKALFIGNSIAYSIATPSMGWDHTSGMAASGPESDFAHLVAAALQVQSPRITNFSALERNPAANRSGIAAVTSGIDAATAVTVELGDNVPLERLSEFGEAYNALLDAASPARSLVCVSTWWVEPARDEVIRAACERHAGTYVFIGDIRPDPDNMDLLEGPQYTDASVQDHPHDWSMARIAERIAAAHAH